MYLPSASKQCYTLLHARHLALLHFHIHPKSTSPDRADVVILHSTDIAVLLPVDQSLPSANPLLPLPLLSITCNVFLTNFTRPLLLPSYPTSLFLLHLLLTHHLLCEVIQSFPLNMCPPSVTPNSSVLMFHLDIHQLFVVFFSPMHAVIG